jgi:hypothetical protein
MVWRRRRSLACANPAAMKRQFKSIRKTTEKCRQAMRKHELSTTNKSGEKLEKARK